MANETNYNGNRYFLSKRLAFINEEMLTLLEAMSSIRLYV